MEQVLEDAELDEAQERRLAREFSREYQLITREDRIDRVAGDLVEHFCGRGFDGKAMVVSVDKLTTVRMDASTPNSPPPPTRGNRSASPSRSPGWKAPTWPSSSPKHRTRSLT